MKLHFHLNSKSRHGCYLNSSAAREAQMSVSIVGSLATTAEGSLSDFRTTTLLECALAACALSAASQCLIVSAFYLIECHALIISAAVDR